MVLIDVSGYDEEYDVYRIEVLGLSSIVSAINILVKISNIEGGHIEVRCDGLNPLNKCFGIGVDDISCKKANINLLSVLGGMTKDMVMK